MVSAEIHESETRIQDGKIKAQTDYNQGDRTRDEMSKTF